MRRGFTLLELLVVMLIILLVSVLVLPTVVTSISERQIVGAASMLQAALAGARDTALRNGSPAGLRFLPDPLFLTYQTTGLYVGQIDSTKAFVSNRWVPLVSGPDYSEGLVATYPHQVPWAPYPPYPPGITDPAGITGSPPTGLPCLVLEQAPGHWVGSPGNWTWVQDNPTSWAWNIRIGEKVQIGSVGAQYTVCGPMVIGPSAGNADMFVNYPSPMPITRTYPTPDGTGTPHGPETPEYLLLVNGQDDNQPPNGYIDDGWDGVDNDGINGTDDAGEWEPETWLGPLVAGVPPSPYPIAPGLFASPYTITRRLFPDPTARETALPSSVVLDLTTSFPGSTHERSRLYVNPYTGAVDLKVMPSGELRFDIPYGVPSSLTMDQGKVVFWLADRGDVFDPLPPPLPGWYSLPMPAGTPTPGYPAGFGTLKGNIRILVANQWGRITTVEPTNFDPSPPPGMTADPEAPYRFALQGP